MATNFGIGGDFLAGLALTGEISDADLKQIVESPVALREAARALRDVAAGQRQKIVVSKKYYSLNLKNLVLDGEIIQLLRDAGYERISQIMPDWPSTIREKASLLPHQMEQLADVLHEKGAIPNVPNFSEPADPEPTDLDGN